MRKIAYLMLFILCFFAGINGNVISADADVTSVDRSADRTWDFSGDTLVIHPGGRVGNTYTWQDYRERIRKVIVEEGVTELPRQFVAYCTKLEEVILPKSLTDIGEFAFSHCFSLKKVSFPEDSELKTIKEGAFKECESLEAIDIPDSVELIGADAFLDCTGMRDLGLPNSANVYYTAGVFEGCGFEEVTIPEKMTFIPSFLFYDCPNLKKVNGLDHVTGLGNHAFCNCDSLETFEFPPSITLVGSDVFEDCGGLKKVIFNNNDLGNCVGLFSRCKSLEEVQLKRGLKLLPHYAFSDCYSLKEIFVPDTVTSIWGDKCFRDCVNLEKIYIPPSVTAISPSAFQYCSKVVIYCVENSYAHKYAKKNNFPYEIMGVYTDSIAVTECFPDVYEGEWYVSYVQYVYENQLMKGSNGKFLPNDAMTRSMVVQTLYNLEGQPEIVYEGAASVLKDVDLSQWDGPAICWAYREGITTGNLNTMTFDGNQPVTREQLAAFLYRYAKLKGYDISQSDELSNLENADQVSPYAVGAVRWAVGSGMISGKSIYKDGEIVAKDLDPQGTATRAQMAAVLMRFRDTYLPMETFEWNGHSYAIFDNCQSFETAKAYCEARGGHLATITSEEENKALYDFMKESGYTSVYFGFSDKEEEGSWKWVTGEETEYVNWNPAEPTGGENENYAMFFYLYEDGTWNDGAFKENAHDGGNAYLCEWES